MVAISSTAQITSHILSDARNRAATAASKIEVLDAITAALSTAGVAPCRVSLEDYKRLVIETLRANRAAAGRRHG